METTERAAQRMMEAAEKMQQAAKDMDYAFSSHQRFLNDWLERLQGSISDLLEVLPSPEEPLNVRIVGNDEEEETDPHEKTTIRAEPPEDTDEVEGWKEGAE